MNTARSKNRSKLLLASITTVIGVMLVLMGMTPYATAQDAPADAGYRDLYEVAQEFGIAFNY